MANREIGRWLERAQTCYAGTPWYGASLLETLEAIDAEAAGKVPQGASNSVAGLVHHLAAWHEFALRKIAGDADFDIPLNTPADWPPSPIHNPQDWQVLKDKLADRRNELAQRVAEKTEAWLGLPVPGKSYTFRYLLEGVAQHDIYHQGQIALVWKLVKAQAAK